MSKKYEVTEEQLVELMDSLSALWLAIQDEDRSEIDSETERFMAAKWACMSKPKDEGKSP